MKKIIIWGCGFQGKKAFEHLRNSYEIIGFGDNDSSKIGTSILGIKVLSLEEVHVENALIFIATKYEKEVVEQLLYKEKIEADRIYVFHLNEQIVSMESYLFHIEDENLEKK